MKHFVLIYMDGNQNHESETKAVYRGGFEEFPVKVGYWQENFLVIPVWFDTEKAAREYTKKANSQLMKTYFMVQERHYPKDDSRIAGAKIIGSMLDGVYPCPSKGESRDRTGEAAIDVWTMYFPDRESAAQYVDCINSDASAAAIALGGETKAI
jgi:hypothetical protein